MQDGEPQSPWILLLRGLSDLNQALSERRGCCGRVRGRSCLGSRVPTVQPKHNRQCQCHQPASAIQNPHPQRLRCGSRRGTRVSCGIACRIGQLSRCHSNISRGQGGVFEAICFRYSTKAPEFQARSSCRQTAPQALRFGPDVPVGHLLVRFDLWTPDPGKTGFPEY